MLKALAFVSLIALSAAPCWAAEEVLEIVRTDGTAQSVTTEDLAAIGSVTLKTTLFAQPDAKDNPAMRTVTGPLVRNVLSHFRIEGETAIALALDAYEIEIPVEDFERYDVVMATQIDGKELSVRERGPLWIIYPVTDHPELGSPVFEARSVWQLKQLRMK